MSPDSRAELFYSLCFILRRSPGDRRRARLPLL